MLVFTFPGVIVFHGSRNASENNHKEKWYMMCVFDIMRSFARIGATL